jgi:ribonuclease E
MLDSELTAAGVTPPTSSEDNTATPAKATRRRPTKASAEAPPDPTAAPAAATAEPAKAPAKRTRRRAADPAADGAELAAPVESAQVQAAAGDAAAPAKKASRARKTTAKAAAAEPAGDSGDAAAAPTTRTRRRATKATAITPDQAPDPDLTLPAEAVPPPPGATAEPTAAAATNHAAPATKATGTRRTAADRAAAAGSAAADQAGSTAGSTSAAASDQATSDLATASDPAEGTPAGRRTRSRRSTRAAATPPPAEPTLAADDAEDEEAAEAAQGRTTAPPAPLALTFMAPIAPAAVPATPAAKPAKAAPAAKPAKATQPAKATTQPAPAKALEEPAAEAEIDDEAETDEESAERRRRRRGRRGRGRGKAGENGEHAENGDDPAEDAPAESAAVAAGDEAAGDDSDSDEETGSRRRRRRRRRSAGGDGDGGNDDPPNTVTHVREARPARERERRPDDEVQGVRGSTRLEAKRQRRRDGRDQGRRRPPILSEAEFLARREAVDRVMVVRQRGDRTQIAVLEDDVLVEHYVTKASSSSYAGNVYLGRVQNVLPSMEAAFIDIGKARNAVLYAGEVNWDITGLEGKARSIEHALKPGDPILVQVTKDPMGHKGARLTSQISLPGRYLVYVPNGSMTGISRKLPDTERSRLKDILRRIVPADAGVIIRTAAEGASEEELTRDVKRLQAQWEVIRDKSTKSAHAPVLLSEEPDLAIRVVRDVFNEDFGRLVVSGDEAWETLDHYVNHVAPDLAPRLSRHRTDSDVFGDLRIDEQLMKALDRKVWLPSGGSLVIDRTEAMTVIDVNTGKFTGQGGTLEQTVTRNNLEAAEEIVRQLRLRDIGGIIVIDFIDMVLESNRDLVLRRLTECLGRDRTKHQVAEVTSLGLVQMTRKRVGQGLLEAFSEPCPTCGGRGLLLHSEPLDDRKRAGQPAPAPAGSGRSGRRRGKDSADAPAEHSAGEPPAAEAAAAEPAAEEAPPTGRRRRGRATRAATNLADAAATDADDAATAAAVAGQAAEVAEAAADAAAEAAAEAAADEADTAVAVDAGTAVGTDDAGTTTAASAGTTTATDSAARADTAPAATDTAPAATDTAPAATDTAVAADTTAAPAAGPSSNGTASRPTGRVTTGRIGAVAPAETPEPEPTRAEAEETEPEVAAEPAPRRRRRAASRPPGPPAAVGAEGARDTG